MLIVVVVLALVAYRFADAMSGEYRAGVRTNDDAQVRLAAVSGLHYAAAVLSDRDTFYGDLEGDPFDNADIFQQFEVQTSGGAANPNRRAFFSIRSVALNDDGSYAQRFGVIDEGGKLNLNALLALDTQAQMGGQLVHDALMKLPNMTEDVADAIVDWLDPDDDARPNGAESSYYMSLPNPYKAKNGPLNSLDELLLVRGVTPYLLYGGDTNRNGVQDDGEQDATRGWSDYLTVYGRELNADMTGTARIYLNGEPDTMLAQLTPAVGDELATYIVASKLFSPKQVAGTNTTTGSGGSGGTTASPNTGSNANNNSNNSKSNANTGSSGGGGGSVSQSSAGGGVTITITTGGGGNNQNQNQNQSQRPTRAASLAELQAAVQAQGEASGWSSKTKINSLMDLVGTQITLPRAPDAKQNDPDVVATSPLNDPTKRNDMLVKLLDKTTTTKDIERIPRLNVNTAPREVLLGVPGMTEDIADKIISLRPNQLPTDPGTVSAAWLLTTDTLTTAQYKQMEPYITGSTMVYRVQAIGYFANGGPVARMEAVIDTNQGAPRFLYIRDLSDLENPRGFQPTPPQQ